MYIHTYTSYTYTTLTLRLIVDVSLIFSEHHCQEVVKFTTNLFTTKITYSVTFTIFFVTTSYQSLKLVTLNYNEVMVTNLRIHYTVHVVIEKLVNITKQCIVMFTISFLQCTPIHFVISV